MHTNIVFTQKWQLYDYMLTFCETQNMFKINFFGRRGLDSVVLDFIDFHCIIRNIFFSVLQKKVIQGSWHEGE